MRCYRRAVIHDRDFGSPTRWERWLGARLGERQRGLCASPDAERKNPRREVKTRKVAKPRLNDLQKNRGRSGSPVFKGAAAGFERAEGRRGRRATARGTGRGSSRFGGLGARSGAAGERFADERGPPRRRWPSSRYRCARVDDAGPAACRRTHTRGEGTLLSPACRASVTTRPGGRSSQPGSPARAGAAPAEPGSTQTPASKRAESRRASRAIQKTRGNPPDSAPARPETRSGMRRGGPGGDVFASGAKGWRASEASEPPFSVQNSSRTSPTWIGGMAVKRIGRG